METFSALLAICAGNYFDVRINGSVNNREAGDLRRYRAHYDVIVMVFVVHPLQVTLGTKSLKESGCRTQWYVKTDFDCSLSQSHLPEIVVVF